MNIFKRDKKEKDVLKEENSLETKVREERTTYFYVIVFAIILFFALIWRFFGNDEEAKEPINTQEQASTIEEKDELLTDLEENNYDMNLKIIIDDDLTKFLIRRENINKELIYKTYRGEEKIYYKNGEELYELSIGGKTLLKNINAYEGYETTFMDINNIVKLIENKTYELDLKEETYSTKRYKIEISRVLDIYNDYNNREMKKKISGEAVLDINYDDESLVGIKLDLTVLYNNLDFDYEEVTYEYKFASIKQINIDSFINNIAQ